MATWPVGLLLQFLVPLLCVEAFSALTTGDLSPRLQSQEAGRRDAGSVEIQEAPLPASAVPKVFINLDLPPRDRFRAWARQFLPRMAQPVGEDAVDALGFWADLAMSEEEKEDWVATLKKVVRPEQLEEVHGVAEEIQDFMNATGRKTLPLPHTVDGLLLASVVYELNYPMLACSGVLVARPDGTVIHGRNLDYGIIGFDRIYDSIEEVVYMRDGKPLYAVMSLSSPYIAATGMRYGGWTIEQNTHFGNDRALNLEVAKKTGGVPMSWEMRHVLETAPDFPAAVQTLLRTEFMAPQYLILSGAGPNEGVVITLHRGDAESAPFEPNFPAPLRITRQLAPEVGVWYLDQTNDEVWGAPLDERRPFEQEQLERLGREGMDEASLMRLLKTPPAFQLDPSPPFFPPGPNLTLYTAVFNVAKGTVYALRGNETL